jgi:flagellar basal body-associated protein FliL
MDKIINVIIGILGFVSIVAVMIFAYWVFWLMFKIVTEVDTPKEQPKEQKVFVSERLEECENKGGRYSLFYVDGEYLESCKTEEVRFDDF